MCDIKRSRPRPDYNIWGWTMVKSWHVFLTRVSLSPRGGQLDLYSCEVNCRRSSAARQKMSAPRWISECVDAMKLCDLGKQIAHNTLVPSTELI